MPRLVCDPQEGVKYYEIEVNGTLATGFPANGDGSASYSLDSLTPGVSYELRLRAFWDEGGGKSLWSDPLTFGVPLAPTGLKVVWDD